MNISLINLKRSCCKFKLVKLTKGSLFVVPFVLVIMVIYNFPDIFFIVFPKPLKHEHIIGKYIKSIAEKDSNITFEYCLINTTGCQIPDFRVRFHDFRSKLTPCGNRKVFVDKLSDYNIRFDIRGDVYNCCYRYLWRDTTDDGVDTTPCYPFRDRETVDLVTEFLYVTCDIGYTDIFAVVRKVKKINDIRTSKYKMWNVLVMGYDTMSRKRALRSLKKTTQYLKEAGWLDFRGFNKVGVNTYPNLIPTLMNKTMSSYLEKCRPNMTPCLQYIIWQEFQKTGHVTAYAEDSVHMHSLFQHESKGFEDQPTDHYLRPLFLASEVCNKQLGITCCFQKHSAEHMLGYAEDILQTYKNDKFFAWFWTSSITHDHVQSPTPFDTIIKEFFQKVHNTTEVLNNTFIFFIGDHGLRVGKSQKPVQSYYEARLPLLFLWVPLDFRESHRYYYNALRTNQERLISPYDIHLTLRQISLMNNYNFDPVIGHASCPNCQSILQEVSTTRSCSDAGIDGKWCSCHGMTDIPIHDDRVAYSVHLVIQELNYYGLNTPTRKCTECALASKPKLLRIHSYKYDNAEYIELCIVVSAAYTFESIAFVVTLKLVNNTYTILQPIDSITLFLSRYSYCVTNLNLLKFCMCRVQNICRRRELMINQTKTIKVQSIRKIKG